MAALEVLQAVESPVRPAQAPRRKRGWMGTSVANVVGIVFTVIMAFPAYWMLNTAFKPANEILLFDPHFIPQHFTFDNFVSAVRAPAFLDVLRNSLIITISAVIAALIVGFLA